MAYRRAFPRDLVARSGVYSPRWLVALVGVLLVAAPAPAEILLPAGFSATVYVTGTGFEGSGTGIPSVSTLAFDGSGGLYLARTGRRYSGGEADDLWPIYRIPVGGARISRDAEARYFHGPPLPNAQVAAVRRGRELLVTTYDRDRKLGVLYRMLDGRAEMFAGGTPPAGVPPLLTQPEGAAVDAAGNIYVADRAAGVVVKLDPSGRVLDPRWAAVSRPRLVAAGEGEHIWVVGDGTAEAPWQPGTGEIVRVGLDGTTSVVARGPVPAAIALSPSGRLVVADRRAAKIFVLDADGRMLEFASFSDGDAPRGLAFAPVTLETRRAGLAGDLFAVVIRRGAFQLNEIVRVSGPFDAHLRALAPGP